MHILQVSPFYYPELHFGGPPRKIHALSKGLAARGHQVSVATYHSEQPRLDCQVLMEGVTVHYLPWRGRGLYQFPLDWNRLRAAVLAADIIHCYGLYDLLCPVAEYYARKSGRPYLVEPLGMFVPRSGHVWLKRIYHRLITRRLARHAAAVVATSPAEEIELQPLRTRRLVLRRNGLDLAQFQKLPSSELFFQRFGLDPNQKVVLFVGRISPIKNLEQLVRAFHRAALPGTVLVLAGPDREKEYVEKIRQLVRDLHLDKSVLLTGPLYDDQQLGALAAAAVVVLPSLSESFGNAAAEAVAAGVPVLLTEGCGIAPLIHQRAGLSVACTEEALADGLRTMITDPAAVARLTAARCDVFADLGWDTPLDQTESLYGELLATASALAE